MDDLIGKQLGDYRVEERIGRGGMARVYRAFQPSVNRQVAIKIIATEVADASDLKVFRERFAREAKVIASLEHAHILPIYDYGIVDDTAYIVMRLLDGGSLSNQVVDGPMPMNRIGIIFSQIARGLAYAHSKGIMHRDLKPANILFDSTGDAYLTDFGLAKWIEGSPSLTQTGKIVGTPTYMSPEQLRGDPADQRADIYSMGIILYQMVTGELPFDTETGEVISIIYQHLEKEPEPPRNLNPNIPEAVERVILKALQKEPDKRYHSITEMAASLDKALGRAPSSSTEIPTPHVFTPFKQPQRQRRARQTGLLAAVISVFVLVMAVSILANQPRSIPLPTIKTDVEGSAEDLVPTSAEIDTAQLALGKGFIAYITCNQTSEYHATQAREMGDFARQYGLDYRVYDSDTDQYHQITQIERARADGAKALIICPLDPGLLDKPLQSVDDANLPLVILSQDLPSFGGVQVIGNEYEMGYGPGQLAGKIIAEEMGGEADVIILDYPDLPHVVVRADGLEAGVLSEAPNAHIIGRYLGATPDFAQASVSKLLDEGVHFDVIVSINDAGSFGAIDALEDANVAPSDVVITSVDAEQLALRYIRQGHYMRGTIQIGRERFSRAAIDAITRLLAGGTLPERILVPPGDVITAGTLSN